MALFSLRKKEKYYKNINSFGEISQFLNIKNREIRLDGVNSYIANEIDTMVRFWNVEDEELKKTFPEREPIKIYINSLGGNLDAALSIVDTLSLSRTPIYVFNTCTVQKESFLIYLAGDKRFCYPNATFMYNSNFLINLEEENDKIQKETIKNIETFVLNKTKINETQYEKFTKSNVWYNAEAALKAGICGEISMRHYHWAKNV